MGGWEEGTFGTWENGRKGLFGTWELWRKGEKCEGRIVGPELVGFLLSDLDRSDVCGGYAIRYDYNRSK